MASAEIGGTISNYLVERCQGASCTNFAQIGTTAGTTYNDTGLTGSTSYSYRVRASDSAGHLSPYSNLAIATTAIVDSGYQLHSGKLRDTTDVADERKGSVCPTANSWRPQRGRSRLE